MRVIIAALWLISLVLAEKHYDGYRVLTVEPNTASDISFLGRLLQEDHQVQFWMEPRRLHHNVTFSVSPQHYDELMLEMVAEGMQPSQLTDNMQQWINDEKTENARPGTNRLMSNGFNLFQYNRLKDIHDWLNSLAKSCDFCKVFSLGQSYEGRELKAIQIGTKQGYLKPIIFIDAGIHAREWIAPATALYIINELISTYDNKKKTRWMVDTYDWIILPSMNPDGYEYTHTDDRMWRKTRKPNAGSSCIGSDPNRNWDHHWMETGASSYPCSDIYAGAAPFSEQETRLTADFLEKISQQTIVYMTLHGYGQYWMTPWGYTSRLPQDYQDLEFVALESIKAVRQVHGKSYTVGSSTNVLYAAAGGSDDWAKGVADIKYAYCVELRDEGFHGFLLPPTEIQPQGEEIWAGLQTMATLVHTDAVWWKAVK